VVNGGEDVSFRSTSILLEEIGICLSWIRCVHNLLEGSSWPESRYVHLLRRTGTRKGLGS
jgi:hypothetical protein